MSRSKVVLSGPLQPHAEGLRAVLVEQGYAAGTQEKYEQLLAVLSGWLRSNRIAPSALTEEALGRFVRGHAPGSAPVVPGLSRVLAFLRTEGVIPAAAVSPDALVLAQFADYLRVQRRLAELTVANTSDVARRFLAYRREHGDQPLSLLTVGDVHGFVLDEATRLRRGAIGHVLEAMRSFLRFLFATGVHEQDLAGTLPAIATIRHADLPRIVDPETLRTLLDSCDRSSEMGLRDFAILILLSRLGLRACEVAAMRLEDINWRAGELVVHGKGGRTDRMPLPDDVGRALVGYLQHGRPVSSCRAVFLRLRPPTGPLSRNGVVFVSRRASRRAGIEMVGAHRLRHTAASRMLVAGASLHEVGQVLRHERDQTTTVYAGVDGGDLRGVVRDWPGASS